MAFLRAFTVSFEEAKGLSMVHQKRHELGGFSPVYGAGKMIHTAKDPLRRHLLQGLRPRLGHVLAEGGEHGIEKPGGRELDFDTIGVAPPQGGHPQQACGQQEGFFTAPPPAIHLADFAGREALGSEHVRQGVIPGRAPQGRDPAEGMPTRMGAIPSQCDPLVAPVGAGAQDRLWHRGETLFIKELSLGLILTPVV